MVVIARLIPGAQVFEKLERLGFWLDDVLYQV